MLKVVVDRDSAEWCWGGDIFWMAYVAAFPRFPSGRWELWDTRIKYGGKFLEGWLASGNDHLCRGDSCAFCLETRIQLWRKFLGVVQLYCSGPIIA